MLCTKTMIRFSRLSAWDGIDVWGRWNVGLRSVSFGWGSSDVRIAFDGVEPSTHLFPKGHWIFPRINNNAI